MKPERHARRSIRPIRMFANFPDHGEVSVHATKDDAYAASTPPYFSRAIPVLVVPLTGIVLERMAGRLALAYREADVAIGLAPQLGMLERQAKLTERAIAKIGLKAPGKKL